MRASRVGAGELLSGLDRGNLGLDTPRGARKPPLRKKSSSTSDVAPAPGLDTPKGCEEAAAQEEVVLDF